MFDVRSKFAHSKFGSFVGLIKVGSVRSKFGKDEVQTALVSGINCHFISFLWNDLSLAGTICRVSGINCNFIH